MEIETVKVGSLTIDPNNARRHSQRNIDAIAKSLQRFGQRRPLVVWRDQVIAGNGTLQAAIGIGWQVVDITRCPDDWTKDEAQAYAIADNRIGELAEWDNETLLGILGELDDDLIAATGFDDPELEDINAAFGDPPDLDSLGEQFNDDSGDRGLVRITFQVDPDIAAMWNTILKATGLEDSDAAAEAMIRAAYDGLDIHDET